jgi:hypothetical protein
VRETASWQGENTATPGLFLTLALTLSHPPLTNQMAITRLDRKVRAVGRGQIPPGIVVHAETIQKAHELEIEVRERRGGEDRSMISIVNLLPRCTQLRTLTLSFHLSSAELLLLGHALIMCPSLETVDLTGCSGFSEEAMGHFLRTCSHVKDLRVPETDPAWG